MKLALNCIDTLNIYWKEKFCYCILIALTNLSHEADFSLMINDIFLTLLALSANRSR